MYPLLKNDKPLPKCFASRVQLPAYVDQEQLSAKKRPYASFARQKWAHTLDLLLPAELVQTTLDEVARLEVEHVDVLRKKGVLGAEADGATGRRYAKVIMSLADIVSGDFFNGYVKKGDVMMISEGRAGVDNCFELCHGTLRLELDKATYERTGLSGKAVPDGGVKHKKSRFAVEIDLRAPSMLPGKKGFDRILWTFEHTLSQSVTWLFSEVTPLEIKDGSLAPIQKHHPTWFSLEPVQVGLGGVLIPSGLRDGLPNTLDDDYNAELLEWISLVLLLSPRTLAEDKVDPFLCCYDTPQGDDGPARLESRDLTRLRWRGFISAAQMTRIFLAATKSARQRQGWTAIQSHGFGRNETVSVCVPSGGHECIEWTVKSPL